MVLCLVDMLQSLVVYLFYGSNHGRKGNDDTVQLNDKHSGDQLIIMLPTFQYHKVTMPCTINTGYPSEEYLDSCF